jgi:hypothetical protein
MEYRWAEGHEERLPGLAADLVRRKVAVIVSGGNLSSTLAAKAATSLVRNRHTTIAEHVPSAHRRYAEWTPEQAARAESISLSVLAGRT